MRGDGTVYKRGSKFWIRYYRDGKPISVSCGDLTEAQARTKLKHEIRKGDADFIEPRLKRVTIGDLVADLIKHYTAADKHQFCVHTEMRWRKHLQPVFGAMKAHVLGTSAQQNYRAQRKEKGASVATINREIQVLRKAFKLAYEHEPPKVKRVPKFLMVKEENARQGFVTVVEFEAIKTAALKEGLEFRVFVELAHVLGWRKGELLNLRVSNAHLVENCIRLEAHETKNKKPREVPLNDELRALLEPLCVGKKPDDWLFPFRSIRWIWLRTVKAAGHPKILFHDLRRSSARTKRQAGIDSSVIMSMQGWLTDSMFRRYGIVAIEDKADALRKQHDYEQKLLALQNHDKSALIH